MSLAKFLFIQELWNLLWSCIGVPDAFDGEFEVNVAHVLPCGYPTWLSLLKYKMGCFKFLLKRLWPSSPTFVKWSLDVLRQRLSGIPTNQPRWPQHPNLIKQGTRMMVNSLENLHIENFLAIDKLLLNSSRMVLC